MAPECASRYIPAQITPTLFHGEAYGARRQFFRALAGIQFLALTGAAQEPKKKLHIMMKSAWGTDDETRATFVFNHGLALANAGHEVQIFLLGDATVLTRKAVLEPAVPFGWPPLKETFEKLVAAKIPVFACGRAAVRVASQKLTFHSGDLSSAIRRSSSGL